MLSLMLEIQELMIFQHLTKYSISSTTYKQNAAKNSFRIIQNALSDDVSEDSFSCCLPEPLGSVVQDETEEVEFAEDVTNPVELGTSLGQVYDAMRSLFAKLGNLRYI